jgi:hypothetical protein
MSEDFVTRLRFELRHAALREERRGPIGLCVARARRGLPGPAPVAAALAAVLLAVAVALGAVALRGEPEPAAPKVIGSYHVAAGLAQLSPGFGAVWTADPIRGEVLRIDPATRRVIARIPVGGEAQVAAGAGAVWAIAGDLLYNGDKGPIRLLRIDPATNHVVARIPMGARAGKPFAPVELQIDRGRVWAIGLDGALRIDPVRNLPDRYVPLADRSGGPRGTVTDGDRIWVLAADGRLRRLDARTGQAAGELRGLAPEDAYLFAGPPGALTLLTAKNQLALVEQADGHIAWRVTLGDDIGRLLIDGGRLWVQFDRPLTSSGSTTPSELVRIDAATGHPQGEVELPEPGVTGMAKVGQELWVGTPNGTIVVVR